MSDTNGRKLFDSSPQTEKLDAALAKAQGQMRGALRDSSNPFFKSKYADLTSVWEACREALTSNGISVTQWPVHSDDGSLHMVTRLACEGQWMLSEQSLPVAKADPQGYGSAQTYARRYGLSAAVGIAPEDDDGNAASQAVGKVREVALHELQQAALKGLAALEVKWKAMPEQARKLCVNDLPKLKQDAANATSA